MTFDPIVPLWVLGVGLGGAVVVTVARARRGASRLAAVGGLVGAALVIAAAADPAVGGGEAPTVTTSVDVLFVVDTTGSIVAEDYDGGKPRLEGVRADIAAIADGFAGARFSLITFDATAVVELPWTTDAGALDAAVRVLQPELSYYSSGTRLDVPVETIDAALQRSADSDEERMRVLVVLTDGEQTAGGDPASFSALAGSADAGVVLGYGTTEGGRMRMTWGVYGTDDDVSYIYDYETGDDAISHADPATLERIADEIGVDYLHREESGGLESWIAPVADGAVEREGDPRAGARRLYWLPAVGLVLLAAAQLAAVTGAVVDDRRLFAERAA